MCLLRGGFTRVEQTLLKAGAAPRSSNSAWTSKELTRSRFETVIEGPTGRHVIGFMSGNQQHPDTMCESPSSRPPTSSTTTSIATAGPPTPPDRRDASGRGDSPSCGRYRRFSPAHRRCRCPRREGASPTRTTGSGRSHAPRGHDRGASSTMARRCRVVASDTDEFVAHEVPVRVRDGTVAYAEQADAETVRRVARPWRPGERPDEGFRRPINVVERRDRHATDDTPGGLASVRQSGGHDRRPADRDREMNGHRGGQQHRCTPLMREQHRARGAAPLQHVLPADQRPRRGGDRRTRGSNRPGRQGVAQESSSNTTPYMTIVSGPGRLLQAPKRLVVDGAFPWDTGNRRDLSHRRPLRRPGSSRRRRAIAPADARGLSSSCHLTQGPGRCRSAPVA